MIKVDFDEIRFECQRCGSCCHLRRPEDFDDLVPMDRLKEFWEKSNLIYLTVEDVDNIGKKTGMKPGDFVNTLYKYDGSCVKVDETGGKVILDLPVMKSKNDTTCIFYNEGCSVYPVRPNACRLFPFRVEERTTPEGDTLLKIGYNPSCPGIGKGELARKGELEKLVAEQFIQRAMSVASEVQRLRASGAISGNAQIYRTVPGRGCRTISE
jgi:Fe-S-cluster containining protein